MSDLLYAEVMPRVLAASAERLSGLRYTVPSDLVAYQASATALVNATGRYRCVTVPVGSLYLMTITWDRPYY